ncbi:MAG: beta-ketoacyl synthase N-terminal-like domain-containing protein [Ferruginibacter sp.]|nr:beta-ketoacyl synthase N-terminal-like domain-containing protein [Ferruginibacter sp.]
MTLYIKGTGNVSPQKTVGHPGFLADGVTHMGTRLACVEPDYKTYIDPKLIRRMSRIIKMGVAAAVDALKESGVAVPDAIVTGTAYGCLEDTGIFLSRMVEQQEALLAPTAFIQSTHNTVGAQIALMLGCNGYNNVFVHRAFSFESALLDAMMLVAENDANTVLVGAVDEITNYSHSILERIGLYHKDIGSNVNLYEEKINGTIAGEGAAFFLLTNEPSTENYAAIRGVRTFYKPTTSQEAETHIRDFLSSNNLTAANIDLVVSGRNGNSAENQVYDEVHTSLFPGNLIVNFKHLCGEYPTATAFATWVAANILKNGVIPGVLNNGVETTLTFRNILIYNHSHNTHHSLILLSAC